MKCGAGARPRSVFQSPARQKIRCLSLQHVNFFAVVLELHFIHQFIN
jgi:hypothetical protein